MTTLSYFCQQLLNATHVSAFYGLLAVSYVLIHAITQRINFAFGALSIWASYTAVNATLWFFLELPGETLIPLLAGGAIAILHTVIAGFVVERSTVRPLLGASSLAMLVTTLGVAIAVEETLRIANASRERWLPPIDAGNIVLGGAPAFPIQVTVVQISVIGIAGLLASGLIWFIASHPFGRVWRACAEDLRMAQLCGVDIGRALGMTFALASAYAAAAGVLIALDYGVASYSGGFVIGLKTLFVAIVGGLYSVPGVFAGGIILGLFETLWSGYLGPEYRDAAAFVALGGLMVAFPHGLFAGRGRAEPV